MLLRRYLALDIKGPRCLADLVSADADIQILMSGFGGQGERGGVGGTKILVFDSSGESRPGMARVCAGSTI